MPLKFAVPEINEPFTTAPEVVYSPGKTSQTIAEVFRAGTRLDQEQSLTI